MARLKLICDCGQQRQFWAENIDKILAQIDYAGWQDYPDERRPLPKGEMHGYCPQCNQTEKELSRA